MSAHDAVGALPVAAGGDRLQRNALTLGNIVAATLANTIAEFSRFTPSTGSFVTFMGRAFGPTTAAATAVFMIVGYTIADH